MSSIHVHDRLLLILSEHSIKSRWVQKEVETAFEKEEKGNRLVLFPIRLDDVVMQSDVGWAADIRRQEAISATSPSGKSTTSINRPSPGCSATSKPRVGSHTVNARILLVNPFKVLGVLFLGKFAQLLCLQRRHVGRTNCGTWGLTNSIRPFP